ncbi:hypothetical protein Acsp04_20570 [Actinomadura sp. NBRC 104425]|uniref:hypothetical protein n=1 Tax=Actinomadura sp. NBRC 104425 TaxID=3032204 RepID=UPI0024A00B07|nr:hypothetical protein [Actinomadura sp. NBRC 104425]GLZ11822.1 hypothetical protein Acsp04_20570 [Actinomadura sp. NBRC 104425]
MGLFALLLSVFAGTGSPVPAAAGMLGLGVGFIFVLTPVISAAAGALPPDQVGAGPEILQGARFLGAGAGPALFGVPVTAGRHAGGAVNPVHSGQAGAAFSGAFLTMAAVVALALAVASRMRPAAARAAVRSRDAQRAGWETARRRPPGERAPPGGEQPG